MVTSCVDTHRRRADMTATPVTFCGDGPYLCTSGSRGTAPCGGRDQQPASFPEIALLLALLLSVICCNVIRLVLAAPAAGFVLLVTVGMAGYGVLELVAQ